MSDVDAYGTGRNRVNDSRRKFSTRPRSVRHLEKKVAFVATQASSDRADKKNETVVVEKQTHV